MADPGERSAVTKPLSRSLLSVCFCCAEILQFHNESSFFYDLVLRYYTMGVLIYEVKLEFNNLWLSPVRLSVCDNLQVMLTVDVPDRRNK